MKTEDYVKYCLNRKKHSIISQFGISILPLHIEIGRCRNIKEDERKCHVYHTFYNMTDQDKFVYLMEFH